MIEYDYGFGNTTHELTEDADEPADTDEWVASNLTVSGSDQQ